LAGSKLQFLFGWRPDDLFVWRNFFPTGALANGLTIAVIGFLMEISPSDLKSSPRPEIFDRFQEYIAKRFIPRGTKRCDTPGDTNYPG